MNQTQNTITCDICGTANEHLTIVCISCGGFLQGRIDNLDLFSTGWKIIESPSKGMRLVAIAKHKNYGFVLSAVAGIALTFFIFWLYKLGDHAEAIVNILLAGIAVGPFVGIVLSLIYSVIVFFVTKISRLRAGFKNILATTSYALLPLVLSVVFILPMEIIIFGTYFFGTNPSPYVLKPMPYVILLLLDGLFGAWTLILLFIGIKTILDVHWVKALNVVFLSLLLFGLALWQIFQILFSTIR